MRLTLGKLKSLIRETIEETVTLGMQVSPDKKVYDMTDRITIGSETYNLGSQHDIERLSSKLRWDDRQLSDALSGRSVSVSGRTYRLNSVDDLRWLAEEAFSASW